MARLNQVLPAYGFTIKDTQQSLGWIDVEYDEPDSEFWKAKERSPSSSRKTSIASSSAR